MSFESRRLHRGLTRGMRCDTDGMPCRTTAPTALRLRVRRTNPSARRRSNAKVALIPGTSDSLECGRGESAGSRPRTRVRLCAPRCSRLAIRLVPSLRSSGARAAATSHPCATLRSPNVRGGGLFSRWSMPRPGRGCDSERTFRARSVAGPGLETRSAGVRDGSASPRSASTWTVPAWFRRQRTG